MKVVGQFEQYDSLHWFQSVAENYEREKSVVESQLSEEQDDKLLQTLTLSMNRLDTYQKEYELLYYGISSARIFFRSSED